jgi:hypothetical protein
MAELRVFLFAGILTLFGAAPIGAQFTATGSSSSLQTTTGATGSAQAAPTAGTPAGAGAADVVNESVVVMPCIPVAAYWGGAPLDDGMPSGPELAIVSTQVRPKNARIYLDGRFVGRARYLDGTPGYFYLEPGAYRLELRFDGYRTVVVELDATAGCKFVIKHYLERVKGEPTKGKADGFGKGKPFERVFSPMPEVDESMAPATAHGPDPSLRLDLTLGSGRMGDTGTKTGASIRLQIDPMSASVSIDGVFVATGEELGQMENPLAMTPGTHLIEVEAPGFITAARNIVLEDSKSLELIITLSRAETD